MNVLYLCYGLPYPPHSGARLRDFYLLRALATRHQVTCLCLTELSDDPQNMVALNELGITTIGVPKTLEPVALQARALWQHVAARRPLATYAMHSPRLFQEFQAITQRIPFDVVQIEHSLFASYRDALPRAFRGKTILDFHNIAAHQYQRMAHLKLGVRAQADFWLKNRLMQGWEAKHAARFDRVLAVSAADARWLRAKNLAIRVDVIENGVDTDQIKCLPERSDGANLLFVGALGYAPNADAMLWFCAEILPLIRQTMPHVTLDIVGRNALPALLALTKQQGVRLHTQISDLQPLYQNANVVIAPLRAGGGTRLKILEAMAFGRAVISTRLGSEGLNIQNGQNSLLADTPSEFAAAVVHLLQHRQVRERLTRRARETVETNYSWNKIAEKLQHIYNELAPH